MAKTMTFMRRVLWGGLVAAGLAVASVSAQAQSPAFLSAIEDLPLMPGLTEDVDGALQFDTANGRIAEITASGVASPSAVTDFYRRTLPQLGWQQVAPASYQREGEVLAIDVVELGANRIEVEVHFRVSPVDVK